MPRVPCSTAPVRSQQSLKHCAVCAEPELRYRLRSGPTPTWVRTLTKRFRKGNWVWTRSRPSYEVRLLHLRTLGHHVALPLARHERTRRGPGSGALPAWVRNCRSLPAATCARTGLRDLGPKPSREKVRDRRLRRALTPLLCYATPRQGARPASPRSEAAVPRSEEHLRATLPSQAAMPQLDARQPGRSPSLCYPVNCYGRSPWPVLLGSRTR